MRRALGSPSLLTQAPHITLVPPVNVRDDDLDAAVAVLRAAAQHCARTLDFCLGPVVTFSPVSPVLYLQVGSDAETLVRLRRLHEDLYLNFAGTTSDGKNMAIIQSYVFPLVTWIWVGFWVR